MSCSSARRRPFNNLLSGARGLELALTDRHDRGTVQGEHETHWSRFPPFAPDEPCGADHPRQAEFVSRPGSGPSSRVEHRHLLAHGRWPEVQLRLMAIVRPASKLETLSRRLSSCGKRHDMMELDESPPRAPPVRADERASAFIAGPLEDGGRVAGRNRVAQQFLRATERVVHVARHRELHLVTFGRERPDDGR